MHTLELFISNGSDTDRYRDLAADVFGRVTQLFQHELRYDVAISNWDYRRAVPTVVPTGGMSSTSLNMVDRAAALFAIFGRRVPSVTSDEIRRAFLRRQAGEAIEVFTFVNKSQLTDKHTRFFAEIADTFGEQIVWTPYTNTLNFQAVVLVSATKFILERFAISNPALQAKGPL